MFKLVDIQLFSNFCPDRSSGCFELFDIIIWFFLWEAISFSQILRPFPEGKKFQEEIEILQQSVRTLSLPLIAISMLSENKAQQHQLQCTACSNLHKQILNCYSLDMKIVHFYLWFGITSKFEFFSISV